ncbi:MAG: two pore domain potassium channel family protein [Chlamydiia bacterium]|nr:two pore domain potassium channel family protein [Chlamydiia bacterium]
MKACVSGWLKLFQGYFTQLLLSLILLFIFRPYNRGPIYLTIWEFLLILVFFSAIFNCDHSKKVKTVTTCLAIPALLFEWINLFYPQKIFTLLFLAFMIIFVFVTTASIIKRVVINARVRLETLRGVVCAYFMVAIGFAFLYFFIDLISPNSFQFSSVDPANITHSHYLSELMYFSFVTLLCIGYGDIIAVKDAAQTCAILEGIVGQFYIAILVSRLVAVYSFFEHKLHLVSKKGKN